MVSYSAKLNSRTKQHTQFGVSAINGSRDMARTKVAEKKEKKKKKKKKKKKNEHVQNYIASPTGIANKWQAKILTLLANGSLNTEFTLLLQKNTKEMI